MAGESRDDVALAEAENLDLTDFITRENARERGEAIEPAPPRPDGPPPEADVREPEEEEPERREPPAPPEPPKKAPRHDRQARMQEAIAKQREAERQRDEARAQLAALQQQPPQVPAQLRPGPPSPQQPQLVGPQTSGYMAPAPPPAADDPEPQFAQFANEADPYTAFILAKSAHQNRQALRNYQQQFQQQQAEQHNRVWATQLKEGLDAQWAKYRTDHPDFEQHLDPEVTGSLRYHGFMPDGRFDKGTQLGNLVAISGLAPNLLSYFSTHKQDFAKIQALEPPDEPYPTPASIAKRVLQGVEFGRVIERLTGGNGNGRQQPVSQARPPIRRPAAAPLPAAAADDGGDDGDLSEAALLRHIREGNAAEGRNRHLRRLR